MTKNTFVRTTKICKTSNELTLILVFEDWALFSTAPVEFGEISKIFKQAKQAGKLGKPKIQLIIFLHPNMEMCDLYHVQENT